MSIKEHHTVVWMFMFPPTSAGCWGRTVEPSWMRLLPYRRVSTEIASPFTTWRHSEKAAVIKQKERACWYQDLEILAFRTLKNKYYCLRATQSMALCYNSSNGLRHNINRMTGYPQNKRKYLQITYLIRDYIPRICKEFLQQKHTKKQNKQSYIKTGKGLE